MTDEQARAAAREILARDEFTRWDQDFEAWLLLIERLVGLTPDWLLRLMGWLQEALITLLGWIGRLLAFFGVFGGASELVGWLAACLLAAALLVLFWRWRSARERERGGRETRRVPARGHADAMREARTLASEGRFLEAAHRVQLATLALLIEFDWLELARSDPNRTLRRRVIESNLPERERRQLVQLVDRLEALWFDEPREDRELFEAWLSLDERIVSLAAEGGA